ncbi:Phosphoribosylaminoimidazole carboxylase pure domain-containing protein, partial [Hysterangium stoloniferum]
AAVMLNLIGDSTNPASVNKVARNALEVPGATVHLYGKKGTRKGRKTGHVTIVGLCEAETRDRLRPPLEALSCSSSTSESYSETPSDITLYTPMPPSSSHPHPFPLVSIIMGSDSDLPVMKAAAEVLRKLRVPSEVTIVSAHRTPERMVEFAKGARGRGVRVIIAGAGGAAHLPGMVAALTSLPVIGVPVKGSILDGVDSLHSIVQMPRGIPVATVAINNAQNGGLLAARILGTGIPEIGDRVEAYMQSMREEVEGKIKKLEGEGWEAYGTGAK